MQTHYDFLDVPISASDEAVRQAIAAKRTTFEGQAPEVPEARFGLRHLDTIAQILLDPAKRKSYDAIVNTAPLTVHRAPPATLARPVTRPLTTVTATSPTSCSVCGNPLPDKVEFCGVCGTPCEQARLQPASNVLRASTSSSVHDSNLGSNLGTMRLHPSLIKVARSLGWRSLRGSIYMMDAPYHADGEFLWSHFLLKAGAIAVAVYFCYQWMIHHLGVIALAVIGLVFLVTLASGLSTLLISQLLTLSFAGRRHSDKQVPVRDLRLRNDDGEHLIRCRGELRSGSLAPGDDVLLWGIDRGGTLMVRFGWNFRTHSRIMVRYR